MAAGYFDRIAVYIVVLGALLTGAAFLLAGAPVAIGAAVGGALSLLNWIALRWVGRQLTSGAVRQKRAAGVLLALKMGVLMVLCWFLVTKLGVDPIGLMVGLTGLVLGVVLGSARIAAEAAAASEES